LEKKLKKGIFITFEGPEGSGKSTHSALLCRWLKEKGFNVIYTREPGGTRISEKLRRILLDKKNKEISDDAEMLIYQAARAQIVKQLILPALKKKNIVVCDRFLDATLAYQGYGAGIDIKMIKTIGKFATSGLKPDLTILLDIETAKGLRRSSTRDRMERKSFTLHKRVRSGYLKLARQEPRRIKVVKVNSGIKKTQCLIRKVAANCLGIK
jgi:dTMP kinase